MFTNIKRLGRKRYQESRKGIADRIEYGTAQVLSLGILGALTVFVLYVGATSLYVLIG